MKFRNVLVGLVLGLTAITANADSDREYYLIHKAHKPQIQVECEMKYKYERADDGSLYRIDDYDAIKRGCMDKKREYEDRDGVYYEFTKNAVKAEIDLKGNERIWFGLVESTEFRRD